MARTRGVGPRFGRGAQGPASDAGRGAPPRLSTMLPTARPLDPRSGWSAALVRLIGLALVAVGAALLTVGPALGAVASTEEEADRPRVEVVAVEGILDRTLVGHVRDALDDARAGGAEVVVLQLDSRGALDVDVDALARDVAASPVPVVAFVGGPGARLAGGGLALLEAAHVSAVAPATLLGPVAPGDVGAATADRDDPVADATRLHGLAAWHDRDPRLAQRLSAEHGAAPEPRGLAPAPAGETELPEDADLPEGLEAADVDVVAATDLVADGVVDLTAPEVPDLLDQLDGASATLLDPAAVDAAPGPPSDPDAPLEGRVGETVTLGLDAGETEVRFANLGLLGQVAQALTDANLTYLLLLGGLLALSFEWFQPGFGVAGVSGVGLLAVAAWGLWLLPVSWLGLLLVVAGVALLALDLAAGGLGVVTAGGTVALAGGSWLLFPGPDLVSPATWVLVVLVAFALVFFVGIMTAVLRAQGQQAGSEAERLIGQSAVVRSMLNPEGHVFAGGQLWRARAPAEAGRLRTGTEVTVTGIDDRLTLEVEPVDGSQDAAGASAAEPHATER